MTPCCGDSRVESIRIKQALITFPFNFGDDHADKD
jgi:hypothetical protein